MEPDFGFDLKSWRSTLAKMKNQMLNDHVTEAPNFKNILITELRIEVLIK